jgi:hypothetical protein
VTRTRDLYDFNLNKTASRLVGVLRKRRNASTVADLVAATGLPKVQVEQSIKRVLDEYGGHLKVTEAGELLYYFPNGMKSRTRGSGPFLRRAVRRILRGTGRALAFLFKVWIMLMLVGYTLLFAAILLAAIVASLAASGRGDDRGRSRGGFGGAYLTSRLLQLLLYMWMFNTPARYPGRSAWGPYRGAASRAAPRRPLYRSVFAYVFGEEDPNRDWEERERIRVIAFLRGRKGVIGLEELMALTGRTPERAQALLNALLVELDGEPSVTEAGTLVYLFPGLLASAESGPAPSGAAPGGSFFPVEGRKTIRFNHNPSGTNGWITFFNGFNLFFGGYFLYFSTFARFAPSPADPGSSLYLLLARYLASAGIEPVLFLGVLLGAVPFSFSLLFYLAALLRGAQVRRANEEIRRENLRRQVYLQVLADPGEVDPREILSQGRRSVAAAMEGGGDRRTAEEERPRDARRVVRQTLDELAALKQAELERTEDGGLIYRFPELARELRDLTDYRRSIDPARFDIGRTVFDSGDGPPREE